MMNFDELFPSFDNDDCGANLEYDSDFLNLVQASVPKPEQQFGDAVIEAQPPDWAKVEKMALELCKRSCDVRILQILTYAWTFQRGLVGYAQGIDLVHQALEKCWDSINPPLFEEDGYEDPMPRVNAISALGDLSTLGRGICSSKLLSDNYGNLTVREGEAIIDGSNDGFPGGKNRLSELLSQATQSENEIALAIPVAFNALQSIEDLVVEKLGHDWRPDFPTIKSLFGSFVHLINSRPSTSSSEAVVESTEISESSTQSSDTSSDSSAKFASWREVQIKTRADAILALEKACAYFEVYEPSHPAPFIIRRLQQAIPLNFFEMLKNLAPSGSEQFEQTWVPREEEDSSSSSDDY
ncbi:type VI secretion system protein TssA [Taylorella equigenitalis]|uniref:type VI secretion system protein TssA n=1 Tax=Taylorella equigenitalis TaxID=29575 RepID=UPI00041F8A02|nr:type VI secretion system protein TssA [Taylorella equigenitalis]ASY37196.1 type VI secretion system protein TssA [Taylorella equigenitalis]KGK33682.1 protein ImpA [Taylorella equigenitalis]RBA27128.1 type VI secretion system protein TssA [Taylorella equigenitalis]